MKTETKVLTGVFIFSAIILFSAVFFLSKSSNSQVLPNEAQVYNIDYSKGQKIGSDSAKVKLVEFSDFQCPACQAAEPYTKQIRENYKDNVQFIYRHFPLPQHIHARAAANFAEYAASQGKFWEVHDKLFETQTKWSEETNPINTFVEIGKEVGLDEAKIREAVEKSSFNEKINQDMDEGKRLNVSSTPTFYLNGQKLNLQGFDGIKIAIEEELKK